MTIGKGGRGWTETKGGQVCLGYECPHLANITGAPGTGARGTRRSQAWGEGGGRDGLLCIRNESTSEHAVSRAY